MFNEDWSAEFEPSYDLRTICNGFAGFNFAQFVMDLHFALKLVSYLRWEAAWRDHEAA